MKTLRYRRCPASLQTLLGRALLISLLYRGKQSDPSKYALLSPWFHATGQRCQIDLTHGSSTWPSGKNPSWNPPCLLSDPYWNGGSHRSVIHRGSHWLLGTVREHKWNIEFVFDDEGKEQLREEMDQFVAEVNETIRDGKVPSKSKTPELIPRIGCVLHVFNHTMEELLAGVPSLQHNDIQNNPGKCSIFRESPQETEGNTLSGKQS